MLAGKPGMTKKNYANEIKDPTIASYIVNDSSRERQLPSIIFTQEDAMGVSTLL